MATKKKNKNEVYAVLVHGESLVDVAMDGYSLYSVKKVKAKE